MIAIVDGIAWSNARGSWEPLFPGTDIPSPVADVAISPRKGDDIDLWVLDASGDVWVQRLLKPGAIRIPGPAAGRSTAMVASAGGVSVVSDGQIFNTSRLDKNNWYPWAAEPTSADVAAIIFTSLRPNDKTLLFTRMAALWALSDEGRIRYMILSIFGGGSHWVDAPGPFGRVVAISACALDSDLGILIAVTSDGVIHYSHYNEGKDYLRYRWSLWSQLPSRAS
jgi:hypothetical protein